MKKYYLALLITAFTLSAVPQSHVHATPIDDSAPHTDVAVDTWMPDKNLREAIRDALGDGVKLTQANMAQLTQLNLTADDISNLDGLQYATNLQSLDLTENSYSDLTPIGALPNLTSLSLRFNHADSMPDLAALKNPNLQSLNLGGDSYGTQPAKLAGLVNLTKLTNLQMFGNNLTALPPIAPNAPLTTLDVSLNKITDVKGLTNYRGLTNLSVNSNKLADWSPIAKLTNLTKLTAGNNPQTNIASLNTLTKLQIFNASQLDLTNQDIKTLLPKMPNLTQLAIDFNAQITDISPVAKLTNLSTLVFSKDSVTDLTPVANLTNLTDLEFGNNQVSDISPLAKLTNLTDLEFPRNQVLDISPLHALNQLDYFNAKFQFITQPTLLLPAKSSFTTNLAAKDIDGTVIPLTYASGTPADLKGIFVTYAPQTTAGSTNFTWSKLGTKSVTKNFNGTVVQPFDLQKANSADQATPVKLLVTKGDNPNLTSVASTFIMQQATLVTHPNGSGILNFKLVVPTNYGKDGVMFKDAKQISAQKAGDSYILNYQLPLTAAQMKEPALLENMHVNINFGTFSYNNIYNVYFKIVHSTNYDPQPPVDPTKLPFDLPTSPSNTSNQASHTGHTSPIMKPQGPFSMTRSVGLQILKGDQSQSASVANQYIQPTATLQVQPNGSGTLLVKAVVPLAFGPNSLTFLSGRQVSAVKDGGNYVMMYALPLTAAQLNTPEFLETMHVDIKVGSFIYNHVYNVYFKLQGGKMTPTNTPTSLINQSFTNAAIFNGGNVPTNLSALSGNAGMPVVPTSAVIVAGQTHDTNAVKQSTDTTASTPAKAVAHATTAKPAPAKTAAPVANNSNRKLAAAATQPQAAPVNVSGDIKKASAFVAALLGVVAVYGGWYWFKQRK